MRASHTSVLALILCCGVAPTAMAQAPNNAPPRGSVVPARQLPPPESSHDPLPPVPSPVTGKALRLVQQAGVGGPVAYARDGVAELGGSVSFSRAGKDNVLTVSPAFGWFIADNVEMSLIAQVSHTSDQNSSRTFFAALVEPSLHVPLNSQTFIFGGMGVGAAYHNKSGAGVAIAPRVGVNVLVGRSGVLTPSASLNWASNGVLQTKNGDALAFNTQWGANVGYSVMW